MRKFPILPMPKSATRSKKKTVTKKKMKMKKTAAKRTVTKAKGRKAMVKKVAKKVTKKLVKKISMKKTAMLGMVGKVVHFYDKIGVAIVELSAPLVVGELLMFQRGDKELFTQPVSSMQINHAPVERAKKGDVVGIKVVQFTDRGTMALRG